MNEDAETRKHWEADYILRKYEICENFTDEEFEDLLL
jgi:hypothetical protein